MEKLLWELLKPGDGALLTYVISGQGEHWKEKARRVTGGFGQGHAAALLSAGLRLFAGWRQKRIKEQSRGLKGAPLLKEPQTKQSLISKSPKPPNSSAGRSDSRHKSPFSGLLKITSST